jgi:lysophospholipase L1-like esterase
MSSRKYKFPYSNLRSQTVHSHQLLLLAIQLLIGAWLLASVPSLGDEPSQPRQALVQQDDRLVLVGATLVERMQRYGYLDSQLALRTSGKLQTRNLGWSGDTVFGISRAVFGTPQEGFQRLINDVVQAKPTVVLLAYGRNEAFAGEQGAASFEQQYRLLAKTISEKTLARLIFLQPRDIEWTGAPLPAPATQNKNLRHYREIIRRVAQSLDSPVIESTETNEWSLTTNGLHPTESGFWKYASWLADELVPASVAEFPPIVVAENDANPKAVLAKKVKPNRYSFKLSAAPPAPTPPQGADTSAAGLLRISGLPDGEYQLLMDGVPLQTATAKQWATGQPASTTSGARIAEQIRQLAVAKNELYFHRYRPQNETYLLLFRKHEQGNNAVEIPQYEPLVEKVEQQIQQLTQPTEVTFDLVRVP